MPEGNNPNMQMTKRERNAANNANTIKNAAEVASKTNNPYAKAIGEGIKAADKMSGGKTTEMLGKQMERANRLSGPAGRKLQKASNRLSESGMGDRIGDAARKSGNPAQGGIGNKPNDKGKSMSGNIPNLESGTQNETKNDVEDTADAGDSSFKLSNKVVKIGLIACACIFPIIIICVCFIGASQTYITAIDLGTADSLTNSEVEDKINKKQDDESEDLDEEIKDDHENLAFDINLNNSKLNLFRNSKLNVLTVQRTSQTYLRRKYNEASIDLIEDFYPTVSDYSKTYDENLVYDFFYKMYKLNESYKTNYNVDLDLPLLINENSISKLYLNFSDPWPQNGYRKRRLVHPIHLEVFEKLLVDGGQLIFKTDNFKLFEMAVNNFKVRNYEITFISYDYQTIDGDFVTEYEARFRSQGLPIHRIAVNVKKDALKPWGEASK